MKIRTQLAWVFVGIMISVLSVFALILYLSTESKREAEFYNELRQEAITKARLFLQAKIAVRTLQDIYKHNRSILNEVEVAIYNHKHELLYHDAVDIDVVKETPTMLEIIYKQGYLYAYQEKWQIVGLRYEEVGKTYLITATAIDQKGYAELFSLQKTMGILMFVAVTLGYVVGFLFADRMLQPIRKITARVNEITSTNLYLRVDTSTNKDEIAILGHTFNAMLNRLEASFEAQKHFVSNISHEVRTPLSAILAEIELCQAKERTIAMYKTTLAYLHQDAQKLVKLSNSLLDFAKASYDASQIVFKEVRLDEILLDAQEKVLQQNRQYQISILFETEILDEIVLGNEYLLKIAFSNLIENACKFSTDSHCFVRLCYFSTHINLTFSNHHSEIPEVDLERIFEPFYRSEQHKYIAGNGIGLALTQKIVALHQGSIRAESEAGKETSFELTIPTVGQV